MRRSTVLSLPSQLVVLVLANVSFPIRNRTEPNNWQQTVGNWQSSSSLYNTKISLESAALKRQTGVNVIKLFSSLLTMRPNKLECLCLANTFQSSPTFAGSTRSLPKKAASERYSNWVCSGLALKFLDLTGKGFQWQTF
jgi:hypothetical protein